MWEVEPVDACLSSAESDAGEVFVGRRWSETIRRQPLDWDEQSVDYDVSEVCDDDQRSRYTLPTHT